MDLQIILNTYAKDIFLRQADCDYISARTNYRMQLRQQFLWSAQQAVEKYLKSILLFNGLSAKAPTHDPKKIYHHNLDLLYSEVLKIQIVNLELKDDDIKFLSYLSKLGGSNRYLNESSYSTRDAIHKLDRLVWHIRRYCQHFPETIYPQKEKIAGLQDRYLNLVRNPEYTKLPHKFKLMNGELEKVISRPSNDPARNSLIWANLWFGKKKRDLVVYNSFSSDETPPHERSWWKEDYLQEVSRYIQFNKKPIN
jgi:HEPN domain-containing protein